MINFVLAHPALLALFVPTILAAIPGLLVKLEKAALARLFSAGDVSDQKAIRGIVKVAVIWAEEKYNNPIGPSGETKLAAVSRMIQRALPFLSADQVRGLIEEAVKEIDSEAKAAIEAPPVPPAA